METIPGTTKYELSAYHGKVAQLNLNVITYQPSKEEGHFSSNPVFLEAIFRQCILPSD